MLAEQNRWQSERRTTSHDIELVAMNHVQAGQLLDISGTGAYLKTDSQLKPGQAITLVLATAKITASAGVKRVDVNGCGIKFDDETIGALISGFVSLDRTAATVAYR